MNFEPSLPLWPQALADLYLKFHDDAVGTNVGLDTTIARVPISLNAR